MSDDFEPPPEPAMIGGGQGRDAGENERDGLSCMVVVLLILAVIGVGFLAAGVGR